MVDFFSTINLLTTINHNNMQEQVNHPKHYGGQENTYEAIKVIEAWDLGFHLGNAVKYISRAGKKSPETKKQDLEKAIWYLRRELTKMQENERSTTASGNSDVVHQ
jgi:hypothetical protein